MTVDCTARSRARTTLHTLPFQVPTPNPTTSSALGLSEVSVAVTEPVVLTANECVAAPLAVIVPLNVSVTVSGVVVVGVVGVSLLHAGRRIIVAIAATQSHRFFIESRSIGFLAARPFAGIVSSAATPDCQFK